MFYLHRGAGSPQLQAQQLHLSEAPLQTQPWAHLAQPTGQQEQQPGGGKGAALMSPRGSGLRRVPALSGGGATFPGEGAPTARFNFPSSAVGASALAQTVTNPPARGRGVWRWARGVRRVRGRQRENPTYSSCRRRTCNLCICRSRHTCRIHLPGERCKNGPWRTERGHAG